MCVHIERMETLECTYIECNVNILIVLSFFTDEQKKEKILFQINKTFHSSRLIWLVIFLDVFSYN